ncbi:MAG: sulfurtransferase TusA family protein [Rhodospirillaceae bacterium]|nr:sulfurtransferase TusA family protein [Rhodospirillaceae bacterium]
MMLTIDARGLNCPLPVLRLRKRLQSLAAGAEVELLATDRAALRDVPAFCESQGHVLVSREERDGCLRFRVRKSVDDLPKD